MLLQISISRFVRLFIMKELTHLDGGFYAGSVRDRFREVSAADERRIVTHLREEKIINRYGKGSGTYYVIGP